MNLKSILEIIFGGIGLAAAGLDYIGQVKGWTGGAKLANELRELAARGVTAFRTDPVFKDEIDAEDLSHYWNAAGAQLPGPPPAQVLTPAPKEGT